MSGSKGFNCDPRVPIRIPTTLEFTHALRSEHLRSDGPSIDSIFTSISNKNSLTTSNKSGARHSPVARSTPSTSQLNRNVNKVDGASVSTEVKVKKNRRRERKKAKLKPTAQDELCVSSSINNSIRKSTLINTKTYLVPKNRGSSTKTESVPVEIVHTFIIRPVENPSGLLFKQRNIENSYIKLRSFVKQSKTSKFCTQLQKITSEFNRLSIQKYQHQRNHRKFPVKPKNNDSFNEPHCSNKNVPEPAHKQSYSPSKENVLLFSPIKENKPSCSNNVAPSARPVKSLYSPNKENKPSCSNRIVAPVQVDKLYSPIKNKRHSSDSVLPEGNKKNKDAEGKKKKKDKRPKRKQKEFTQEFPEFCSFQEVQKGLAEGQFIKGAIRINPKNPRDSYVSNEDSTVSDYYITSVLDRNRALEGDEVILKLKPEKDWSEGKPTATVVYIENRVHPRISVGFIKPLTDRKAEYAIFCPRDKRIPLIRLPPVCWPSGFKADSKQFESVLFVVKIVEWTNPSYAMGTIVEKLGVIGDLKVETKSILREYCLDVTPFSPNIFDYLPKSKVIPQSEIDSRRDIRKECVFTIDPLTARDLDDAVSVKQLPNGNYEIGVHISDASYYLEEGTELDQIVSKKATTIYLVDNVYHMLPVELCLHCSLLPGEDKLAFSVFWEINEFGEIFDTKFTRTVLNSCTQLAYEHAQMMIEDPDRKFEKDDLPKIHNGFTSKNLSDTVNVLQKIALNLRQKRVANGALRIDQTKLLFSLNPKTGEPLDFRIYENKDAHRLIEEFMLLANISVANKINDCFPDLAFLRCHEPPKNTMLRELQSCLATCGIHVDISSSGGINASIRKYITDDFAGICRGAVLNHLLAKPMTRARYFCAGSVESDAQFQHYALSVPIYTHFTSPIRRYADIMVHRLLAASLEYSEKPPWDLDYVRSIAANCNAQKYNAKRAGEASSDLYLVHFIEKHQPYVQNCVVVDVKDRSFDAIVLQTGSIIRLYQKTCEGPTTWNVQPISTEKREQKEHEKKVLKLVVTFPKTQDLPEASLNVEIFTLVKVKLQRKDKTTKIEATLLRPIVSQTFMMQ